MSRFRKPKNSDPRHEEGNTKRVAGTQPIPEDYSNHTWGSTADGNSRKKQLTPPEENVKRNEKGQLLPGAKLRKGLTNAAHPRRALSHQFLMDVHEDWKAYGPEVLQRVRNDDPSTYLRVIATLIPKNLEITDSSDGKSVKELKSELLIELGRAIERGDPELTKHIEGLQQGRGQGPLIEVQAVQKTDGVP